MTVVNMTPHDIVVEYNGTRKIYKASGNVARLEMSTKVIGELDGFPIQKNTVAGHNLPEEQNGVFLLVSAMILGELKGVRGDLIAPNTNAAVRNEKGHIISVPGFVS